MDCIFCKIINGEIPSAKVYEDEYVYAFNDISPCAPVHVLFIPKKHIQSVSHIESGDEVYVSAIFSAIKKVADELNLGDGYRVVTNTGDDAGQTVKHLHFHLIGGRSLQWPPGW